jgi:hypothetical protein
MTDYGNKKNAFTVFSPRVQTLKGTRREELEGRDSDDHYQQCSHGNKPQLMPPE